MSRRAELGAGAALFASLLATGCSDGSDAPRTLARSERLGILRDLEFFPRSPRLGGPFFLDRFESTRLDWSRWVEVTGRGGTRGEGPTQEGLPAVGMTLDQARAFARWRFGRVPRYDEWLHAATGGGLYRRPWGNLERPSWANTQELGLGGLTPVGAFESGRQPGGPYDLIGNAGEWTETPDPRQLPLPIRVRNLEADPAESSLPYRLALLARHPAAPVLAPVPGAPWPYAFLVEVDSRRLPRLCAAGWTRPATPANLTESHYWATSWWYETLLPGEFSSVIGVRVATDPDTLVELLTALEGPLTTEEATALRTFLRRFGVRDAMVEAAARAPESLQRPGAAAQVLREELGA